MHCHRNPALTFVDMTAMDVRVNHELASFPERSGELSAMRFNAGLNAGAIPITSVKDHPLVIGDRLTLPASLT